MITSSSNILLNVICQRRMHWCHFYPLCTLVCPFSHYAYILLNDLHCCLLYYIVEKSAAESEHILHCDKINFHACSHFCIITVIICAEMTDSYWLDYLGSYDELNYLAKLLFEDLKDLWIEPHLRFVFLIVIKLLLLCLRVFLTSTKKRVSSNWKNW